MTNLPTCFRIVDMRAAEERPSGSSVQEKHSDECHNQQAEMNLFFKVAAMSFYYAAVRVPSRYHMPNH